MKNHRRRSEQEMFDLILQTAEQDNRILAVILNGSRANPHAKKDIFQDYDIIYAVKEVESFKANHTWIDRFGERLILQMPNHMVFPPPENDRLVYLIQFKDFNRIDLSVIEINKLFQPNALESLSIVLLDKEKRFSTILASNETDHLIRKPIEKEFQGCCNEFWWVNTYVAKGLWRGEITYAKDMLENPVRAMLMKMLEWYIGIKTDFEQSFGKCGKNIQKHVSLELWNQLMATYPTAESEEIWKCLFLMGDLFHELAIDVAQKLKFEYNLAEEMNVRHYLESVKSDE